MNTTLTGPQAQEAALSELLALSENATPGPWIVESEDQGHPAGLEWCVRSPDAADEDYTGWIGRSDDGDNTVISTGCPGDRRDAEFICAAVNWFRANAETLATPARVVSASELPELPVPGVTETRNDMGHSDEYEVGIGFTADQMRAYAQAALSTLKSGAEGKDGEGQQ